MSIILDNLFDNIADFLKKAKTANSLDHSGLKGRVNEELFGNFLSEYLNKQWSIGSGKIVDPRGRISAETDLFIHDEHGLPKTTLGKSVDVMPIESCRYIFEVKTKLNATEIKTTIEKFYKLKEFDYSRSKKVFRVLFAYSSDLKKENELERIKKYDVNFHTDPAIQIILIVDKGYWFHAKRNYKVANTNTELVTSHYYETISRKNNFEIVMFLSALLQTLNPDKATFYEYVKNFHDFNKIEVVQSVILDKIEHDKIISGTPKEKLIVDRRVYEKVYKQNWLKKIKYKFLQKSLMTSEPIMEVTIINEEKFPVYIDSISILTSENLCFFLPVSENGLEYPLTIEPYKNLKIQSRFICFPKRRKNDKAGGIMKLSKGGTYHWEHDYKFKQTTIDKFGVIQVVTIKRHYHYSSEINLTQLSTNERYIHLDFLFRNLGEPKKSMDGAKEGMVIKKGGHTYRYEG
ncbi:hypothetical protein LX97_02916 [Nonlabens dokdonensis]|uniref:DUF6602 domain-containing protein n=2 Tax=Nonlabens dokdonensis TaxID=328515 RepID=L7WEF9_NONDD|nr:DUF6602 domain-containing protein [Nonlabens dokdonensis]AGC78291.1 hypothetical protein DDD_3164 [Nonlabens dokdonensis DSW-6]PZX37821.1 hypothetical protein LX97_02916 [Nonlabens dokdonensis]